MSLLWSQAIKRDWSELHASIDEHAHDLPKHAGLRMDSPDINDDAEFGDVWEHAGACRNKACAPRFHMMDLTSGKVRGNQENTIDHEHVKNLVKNPSGRLPEVIKWRGEHHIVDGHHRILSHMLRGDGKAPVLVHDGDSYLDSPMNMHTHRGGS